MRREGEGKKGRRRKEEGKEKGRGRKGEGKEKEKGRRNEGKRAERIRQERKEIRREEHSVPGRMDIGGFGMRWVAAEDRISSNPV